VSVTGFETRFTNLIASTPNFRSVENIQRARTRGAEVSARLVFGATELRTSYTFLEADNLTAGTRLLRRPRHRAGVDVTRDFSRTIVAGFGWAHVAQREDVDARTFRVVDGEDYTVLRIYGSWQVRDRITVKARIENLLDERYEDVNGYPALGVGAFAGLEWRF
jgi:vitamin B12 transporter